MPRVAGKGRAGGGGAVYTRGGGDVACSEIELWDVCGLVRGDGMESVVMGGIVCVGSKRIDFGEDQGVGADGLAGRGMSSGQEE